MGGELVQSWHFGWQPVLELTCDQVYFLAPSDFCCFPKLKEFMKGHKVSDDENVNCMTNVLLEDQEQQFFYNGIRTLEKPWTKCISVAGEYVVR